MSVQYLSDEEIVKIFNDKQSKYIEIEYLENNLKKRKVKNLENKTYEDHAHRIKFKPTTIDKIDSAESTYTISYIYSVIWEHIYYDEIAKKVNSEMLNKFPEYNQDLEEYGWFCLYDEDSFKKLKLFEPEINITNLVQQSTDEVLINYEFAYVPKENQTLYVTKTKQGVGKFSLSLIIQAFYFDKQKMTFFFSNNDPFYAYNEAAELTQDGHEYLKNNIDRLNF